MTRSHLLPNVRRALLPLACASALAGCAPYYEPVATPVSSGMNHPDELFARLDTNRDGYLSRGELEVMASAFYAPATAENTTDAFRRLDVDRDGFLSRSEAGATVSSIPGATFDQIDSNRDGFLSAGEAAPHLRWLESRNPPITWVDNYDVNRDGFLTRTEADPLLRSTRYVAGRYEVIPRAGNAPLTASFERFDANRDGFLSRAEAAPLMSGPATFDQHDAKAQLFGSTPTDQRKLASTPWGPVEP